MLVAKQAEITQKLQKLQLALPDASTPTPSASKAKPAKRPATVAPDSSRAHEDGDDDASDDEEEQSGSDGDDQTFGFGLVICPKTQKASW